MKSILKAYRDTIVYKEEEIGCHCCYYLLALNANSIDYIAFDSEFLLLLARIHTALVQRVHIYKCFIKRLLTTALCITINKFTLLLSLSLSLPPPSQSLCLVIFIFNFNSKFLCAKSIDSRALNTRWCCSLSFKILVLVCWLIIYFIYSGCECTNSILIRRNLNVLFVSFQEFAFLLVFLLKFFEMRINLLKW